MTNKVLYHELLPHEFVERMNAFPIAYLPLGTLEWHSFHLPYGVDMLLGLEAFKRVAVQAGGVVLPPLFLGPDGDLEHDGKTYYGMDFISFEEGYPQQLIGSSYYVPEPFYVQILENILKNLKRTGFAALVGIGHGPSTKTLLKNRERFEAQFKMKILSLSELCSDDSGEMPADHAAFNETVMMMGLNPDLVDLSLLPEDKPPVAVWGQDPCIAATKEEGERIITLYGEQASQKLIDLNKTLPKPNLKLEFHHVRDLRS